MTGGLTAVFDGTFDGLLNVVYQFYYEKLRPERVVSESGFQQKIGESLVFVETDYAKSERVAKAFLEKTSQETYESVYQAFLGSETDRFTHILKYIVLAFSVGDRVFQYEKYDYVTAVRKYSINTYKEAHLLKGFTRFRETKSGVLYAEIAPRNDALPILAEHFADRLSVERFVIRDVPRDMAVVYENGRYAVIPWPLLGQSATLDFSEDEAAFELLFGVFHKAIAVEERVSYKRQRRMLPLRYRDKMTEFTQKHMLLEEMRRKKEEKQQMMDVLPPGITSAGDEGDAAIDDAHNGE